ncbi:MULTISPECIES: ChrR family anti-sigma-E factor [Vibrio]|uniref:Transcriptional regulator n=2 Tax=Vibrio TaxID=662 RepID=A0A7X4LGX7_9VIBR|nr:MULTISPECIES: ChrR family anti-sigma-E factor [Vibrio]MBF8999341.1 cupin domain-containing protein [Vibrio nitrifigilis]MZI91710.1 transcriptional regulator [Vibrio eleionomae]
MSHHPESNLLAAYADGSIDYLHGIAVSAHLEFCPHCRATVRQFEQVLGDQLSSEQSSEMIGWEPEFDAMFENIVALPQAHQNRLSGQAARKASFVNIEGQVIRVPRVLQPFVKNMKDWRSYGGRVLSLALDSDEDVRLNLMYMKPGVSVPQHTHRGIESTLVLHGGFSDEDGHYEAGDFMQRDASIKHSPQTSTDQDCLCLTVLTDTMLFTQGVARLFNRFGKGLYP